MDMSTIFQLIMIVFMFMIFWIFIFHDKTESKMFGFIKKVFIGLLSALTAKYFCESLASNSEGHIKCVYQNNRPCQARPIFDINSNETLFHTLTLSVNKCNGSCNTINNPYVQVSVHNNVIM